MCAAIYISIFDVQFTLEAPREELGDPVFSPQFGRTVRQVPVAHVFGYTPNNTETPIVLHIHGAMPYFYVPQYDISMSGASFAALLEQAASEKLFFFSSGPQQQQQQVRIVHHAEVVEGVPFYGYHTVPRRYYKIFVYNPAHINRLSNLLGSTAFVGGRRWQPCESHIPFHLQLLADVGLSGMSYAKLTSGQFRTPLPPPLLLSPHLAAADGTAIKSVHQQVMELVELSQRQNAGGDEDDDDTATAGPATSAGADLNFSLLPLNDPPRMGRSNILEIDTTVQHFFQHNNNNSSDNSDEQQQQQPGASFRTCRSALRRYLRSIGHAGADDVLDRAAAYDTVERKSVANVQDSDAIVRVMRKRALEIDQEIATTTMMMMQRQQGQGGHNMFAAQAAAASGDAATSSTPLQRPPDRIFHSGILLHELSAAQQQQQQMQQHAHKQQQRPPPRREGFAASRTPALQRRLWAKFENGGKTPLLGVEHTPSQQLNETAASGGAMMTMMMMSSVIRHSDSQAAQLEERDLSICPTFNMLEELANIDVDTTSDQILNEMLLQQSQQQQHDQQHSVANDDDQNLLQRRLSSALLLRPGNNNSSSSSQQKEKLMLTQFLSLERRRSSSNNNSKIQDDGDDNSHGDEDIDRDDDSIMMMANLKSAAPFSVKSQLGFRATDNSSSSSSSSDAEDDIEAAHHDHVDAAREEGEQQQPEGEQQQPTRPNRRIENHAADDEVDVVHQKQDNDDETIEDPPLFADDDDDDDDENNNSSMSFPKRRSRREIITISATNSSPSQRQQHQQQQQQQQQNAESSNRRKTVRFASSPIDDSEAKKNKKTAELAEHGGAHADIDEGTCTPPLFAGEEEESEDPAAAIARLLYYSQPPTTASASRKEEAAAAFASANGNENSNLSAASFDSTDSQHLAANSSNNNDKKAATAATVPSFSSRSHDDDADDDDEVQILYTRRKSIIEVDCSSSTLSSIAETSSLPVQHQQQQQQFMTPPEQTANGMSLLAANAGGSASGPFSAIRNALDAFKKLRTPAAAAAGQKNPMLFDSSAASPSSSAADSRCSSAEQQHSIEHLSQLMKLMTHPSMPFLTVVTPRHGVNRDDRAGGFKTGAAADDKKKNNHNNNNNNNAAAVGVPRMRRTTTTQTAGGGAAPSQATTSQILSFAPPDTKLSYLRVVSLEGMLAAPPGFVGNAATQPLVSIVVTDTTASVDSCSSVFFTTLGGQSKQHATTAPLPSQMAALDFLTEEMMLQSVLALLCRLDPDVIVSWSLIRGGFASFVERCRLVLGVDVTQEMSRLKNGTASTKNNNNNNNNNNNKAKRRDSGGSGGNFSTQQRRRSSGFVGAGDDVDGNDDQGGSTLFMNENDEDDNNNNNDDMDDDDNDDDDEFGGHTRRGAFAKQFGADRLFSMQLQQQQQQHHQGPGQLAAALGIMNNGGGESNSAPGGIHRMGSDAARSAALPLGNQQLKISGRIVMGLWKLVRSELKQKSYTLQAVHQALFGSPFPHIEDDNLFAMASSPREDRARHAASLHLVSRSIVSLRVCRHLDVFVRTAELAQIFGILFFEVLSRGSQFRVESVLTRYTKPLGYVNVSPTREQVMLQNRQEGIPLVMEPKSQFCADPLIVLDFRSLYPSICIAYNLCYSTLLGKVSPQERIQIGAIRSYRRPLGAMTANYQNHNDSNQEQQQQQHQSSKVTFSPNSAAFVPTVERLGVFPAMLNDILSTRFQVQAAMKLAGQAGDAEKQRVFDAQQAGLKMLANVSYGYTAATFTGRMPCSDIADSIVLLGRQTLERAIRKVEGTPEWAATVEYADTDSMFVRLPGRTKDEAFRIGREIVLAVNRDNPQPVTLKLEKVYLPSFLIVKKRYVGYAYESEHTVTPKFDAKGIETVRRDQCPATAQVMTEALRLWFETQNQTQLKRYIVEQLSKIHRGDMRPNALVLRREVKLGSYASEASLPPGARVAMQRMIADPASAPQQGERVPYVVVCTESALLKNSVIPAAKLLQQEPYYACSSEQQQQQQQRPQQQQQQKELLIPNGKHYIDKHIVPSLQRVFHLIGLDVVKLAKTMPKITRRRAVLFEPDLVVWKPGGPSLLAQVQEQQKQQHQHLHQQRLLQNSPSKGASFVNRAQQHQQPFGATNRNNILVQLATAAAQSVSRSMTTATTAGAGGGGATSKTPSIHLFYQTALCAVCQKAQTPIGAFGFPPVCRACLSDRPNSLAALHGRRRVCDIEIESLDRGCTACLGGCAMPDGGVTAVCDSVDCDVPFDRQRVVSLRQQFDLLCSFIASDEADRVLQQCFGGAVSENSKQTREVVVV